VGPAGYREPVRAHGDPGEVDPDVGLVGLGGVDVEATAAVRGAPLGLQDVDHLPDFGPLRADGGDDLTGSVVRQTPVFGQAPVVDRAGVVLNLHPEAGRPEGGEEGRRGLVDGLEFEPE
jgi:hypothetical protein